MQIKFWLETNKVGSLAETVVDVDDDEWDELSEVEREAYAKEMFWDVALTRLGDWDWSAVEIASRSGE